MVNEATPFQLTVGRLRELLADVDDNVVIGLIVPKGGIGDPVLTTIYNLGVEYSGGLMVRLVPVEGPNKTP